MTTTPTKTGTPVAHSTRLHLLDLTQLDWKDKKLTHVLQLQKQVNGRIEKEIKSRSDVTSANIESAIDIAEMLKELNVDNSVAYALINGEKIEDEGSQVAARVYFTNAMAGDHMRLITEQTLIARDKGDQEKVDKLKNELRARRTHWSRISETGAALFLLGQKGYAFELEYSGSLGAMPHIILRKGNTVIRTVLSKLTAEARKQAQVPSKKDEKIRSRVPVHFQTYDAAPAIRGLADFLSGKRLEQLPGDALELLPHLWRTLEFLKVREFAEEPAPQIEHRPKPSQEEAHL